MLFRSGGCSIVFVALHAPHRGSDSDELTRWWAETEDLLFRCSRGRLLVVGADCNACLGSVLSAGVSDAGAEEQDAPGDLLHSLILKCRLWAPTILGTMSMLGRTWTFAQRRNGALTRADYILLPLEWQPGVVCTWSCPRITAANMVLDHIAVLADVRMRLSCAPAPASNRRPRICIQAISDPGNRAHIQRILEEAPRPPWEVTADAHVAPAWPRLSHQMPVSLFTRVYLGKPDTCRNRWPGCAANVHMFEA